MGLTGQLESLTLSFGKLRALDLSRNTLFGMMPHFSGSLRELNLSDNAFSGPLRDDMAYLQQLEVLDLSGNNFQVRVLGGAWQRKQQACLVCASHAPNLCSIRLRNQSGGYRQPLRVTNMPLHTGSITVCMGQLWRLHGLASLHAQAVHAAVCTLRLVWSAVATSLPRPAGSCAK